MKKKTTKINPEIKIKPEERDLDEIIQVLIANINSPRGSSTLNPDFCFTKGQLAYIVSILEQHQKAEQNG